MMQNSIRKALSLVFFLGLMAVNACSQNLEIRSVRKDARAVYIGLGAKSIMKVSVVSPEILRFQFTPDGKFATSASVKLGLVNAILSKQPVPFSLEQTGQDVQIVTDSLRIDLQRKPFRIIFRDAAGNLLLQQTQQDNVEMSGKGDLIHFDMPADEHFFGFGFMRNVFDARGHAVEWKTEYRWEGATVPFFMSTRHYGIFSNNTWNTEFNFRGENGIANSYSIKNAGGQIDFFFIYGRRFPSILDGYTDITGKPMLPPKWAMGAQYRARYFENQQGVLKIARTFRRKDIPFNIIGLEPGWMEKPYYMNWKWSKVRFPHPEKMINELGDMGFKLGLWESGYSPVIDVTNPAALRNWYKKRLPVLKMGVKMFKQDDPYPRHIDNTGDIHSFLRKLDFKTKEFPSGELTNIVNSLYSKTAYEEFRKYTHQRGITEFCSYNASVASQRWPFEWGSDFAGGMGLLDASLSAQSMVSYDIRDFSPEGIHAAFLTPFVVDDSWAYFREPWLFSEKTEQEFKFYARFREKLAPYLYSTLWKAHSKGTPMLRPMVLEYQNDPESYSLTNQFMLGKWLLVGAEKALNLGEVNTPVDTSSSSTFSRIYLPSGEWINYWSGRKYVSENGKWITSGWPDYAGGLLFVKAGAIIPVGQVDPYLGEKPYKLVTLEIYPKGKSTFNLYEDDGTSYDYEQGQYELTHFVSDKKNGVIRITSHRQGKGYQGMPDARAYLLKVYSKTRPASVSDRHEKLPEFKDARILVSNYNKGWSYDVRSKQVYIKTGNDWKFYNISDQTEDNPAIGFAADSIAWRRSVIEPPLDISINSDKKPRLVCDMELHGIPADNISQSKINISVKAPGSNQILKDKDYKVNLSLKGPAVFPNGNQTFSVMTHLGRAHVNLISKGSSGRVLVTVTNPDMVKGTCRLEVYGKPDHLAVAPEDSIVLADGISTSDIKATVLDANGYRVCNAYRPLVIHVDGGGSVNGKTEDTVWTKEGICQFTYHSPGIPSVSAIEVKGSGLGNKRVNIKNVPGELQVKLNPPRLINLRIPVYWIPKVVDVFVTIRSDGKIIANASNIVTLKVFDKDGKFIKELKTRARNGEAVFKHVTYAKRPAQYIFKLSSPGLKGQEVEVYKENF